MHLVIKMTKCMHKIISELCVPPKSGWSYDDIIAVARVPAIQRFHCGVIV